MVDAAIAHFLPLQIASFTTSAARSLTWIAQGLQGQGQRCQSH